MPPKKKPTLAQIHAEQMQEMQDTLSSIEYVLAKQSATAPAAAPAPSPSPSLHYHQPTPSPYLPSVSQMYQQQSAQMLPPPVPTQQITWLPPATQDSFMASQNYLPEPPVTYSRPAGVLAQLQKTQGW